MHNNGYSCVCGQNKITGAFHDFSLTNTDDNSIFNWFEERTQNLNWNKPRQLPEWAKQIFSPAMIAAGNLQDIEEINQLPKEKYVDKFLHYVLDKLKHNNNRVIIEGIHLLYADFSLLSRHPIIIKGEGYLEATQRAFQRDKELGEEHLSVLADDNIEFGKRIKDLENYLKTSK
jgi:hypothetical protein